MEIAARHKKEQKELLGNITGLKKQATKKTKRSVLEKCAELQRQLDERHKQEIQEHQQSDSSESQPAPAQEEITPEFLLAQMSLENENEAASSSPASVAAPAPRRNRQKERLAKRKANIDQIKLEASLEAADQVDYRQIEVDSMAAILDIQHLYLHEIKPDGHCLFASIQDQLKQRHDIEVGVAELREQAAEYISENRDDFIPFLFDETTCEIRDVDDYVKELVSTSMWGSDMEILALGRVYDCCISVYIAGASTLEINAGGEKPGLKLGYYKHSYGLGEHYNSLRSVVEVEEEESKSSGEEE